MVVRIHSTLVAPANAGAQRL